MSKEMTSAEIREAYLKFFEDKNCQRWQSSSLIPQDPSLLLTVAGMVQFKPYFLQQKHIDSRFLGTCSSQKCVRTNDIDIIGTDGHHLSFFEMLGNFSFGGYFKKEMCAWAWEFSTKVLEMDPKRIYVTVFTEDDEAAQIWEQVGVEKSHISRLGEEDNFWAAGPTGPCGPCSEMYYDFGEDVGCKSPDCKPGCDCERFVEYWNLVFTQYDRQEDGSLVPLEKKNIDTGMGLERVAAILQGKKSNYDSDILHALIEVGEKLTNFTYGENEVADLALRILADHSRAICFMIADGILPSNEGRGYVLRRLLRRAIRRGYFAGIEGHFLHNYLDVIIDKMGEQYPELEENKSLIEQTLAHEEDRFQQIIVNGEHFLTEAIEALEKGEKLSGKIAFTLHDTYGYPLELTKAICEHEGVEVDEEAFEVEMKKQRDRARAAQNNNAWADMSDAYTQLIDDGVKSEFLGYRYDESDSSVTHILLDGKPVQNVKAPAKIALVLDKTPFYGEMGGQIGDMGTIENADFCADVIDTIKPDSDLPVHICTLNDGQIKVGDKVEAYVDTKRRARIARNHTATHILQRALQLVLGKHVKQAGSSVSEQRLRFDFTHFQALTPEELAKVERLCNDVIMRNLPVRAYETSLSAAREAGVLALFGEKYGDFVRVIEVGDFSKELCGGTHIASSAEIGLLKITLETSVGANTRRIEAVTSYDAYNYVQEREDELARVAQFLHCKELECLDRLTSIKKRIDELELEAKIHAKKEAADQAAHIFDTAIVADGYKLLVQDFGEALIPDLRGVWDEIKAKCQGEPFAVAFASINPETKMPILMCAANKAASNAGFDAGACIKAIAPHIKGGGGGKPNMAVAGGKDASGIQKALDAACEFVKA